MRSFEDLSLEEGQALMQLLVEQGLITAEHNITPLGEEYITAMCGETPSFVRAITNAWYPPVMHTEEDEEDTRKLEPMPWEDE